MLNKKKGKKEKEKEKKPKWLSQLFPNIHCNVRLLKDFLRKFTSLEELKEVKVVFIYIYIYIYIYVE